MSKQDNLKELASGITILAFVFVIIIIILYTVDFIVTLACPCINSCVGCYQGGICQYSGLFTIILLVIILLAIWIGTRRIEKHD